MTTNMTGTASSTAHAAQPSLDGSAAEPGPLMQCPSIAHLGGATLDNEENYLIKKLFTGGLGMVALSNQARI